MDYKEQSNSDDDIFVKEEKPKKLRKRAPRQMTDETRERMAAILAKGRETRLRNNELKREALLEDKQRIKETLKSKLKEVKKQLKEELVSESIEKKKKKVHIEPKPEPRTTSVVPEPTVPEPTVPKPENPKPEPTKPELKPEPIIVNPEPKAHRHDGTTKVVPEPPKTQPKPPNQVSAPIPIPKPSPPKPNLTAEYMRKLRAAYNF